MGKEHWRWFTVKLPSQSNPPKSPLKSTVDLLCENYRNEKSPVPKIAQSKSSNHPFGDDAQNASQPTSQHDQHTQPTNQTQASPIRPLHPPPPPLPLLFVLCWIAPAIRYVSFVVCVRSVCVVVMLLFACAQSNVSRRLSMYNLSG